MQTVTGSFLLSAWATLLTERERHIVALAVLGQHNKLIAYNLGISHSTVRVPMARAARKLGAQSRDELIRRCEDGAERCPANCASEASDRHEVQ
jgi:DNA-binding CsgD family transcriptional regulator